MYIILYVIGATLWQLWQNVLGAYSTGKFIISIISMKVLVTLWSSWQ
jgi:hypothetical protein